MKSDNCGFQDDASARIKSKNAMQSGLKIRGFLKVVCRDADGNVKWVDDGENLIVDEGIDYILGTAILDAASLFIGLTEASPTPAAGDTMASHAGWATAAGYDEANRISWGQDSVASKVVTNSTSADFTMDGADTSIGGAFITTNNTKDGTTGTLIAVKAFTGGNKTVADNDVLQVTYTITGSSS